MLDICVEGGMTKQPAIKIRNYRSSAPIVYTNMEKEEVKLAHICYQPMYPPLEGRNNEPVNQLKYDTWLISEALFDVIGSNLPERRFTKPDPDSDKCDYRPRIKAGISDLWRKYTSEMPLRFMTPMMMELRADAADRPTPRAYLNKLRTQSQKARA
ncbi:hypothetical protein BDF19DRAFT_291492 [Syncephalis fuscata]|nr:hypothetical protein BDF19DRAFT_291492 [Syncephalis fuscata]